MEFMVSGFNSYSGCLGGVDRTADCAILLGLTGVILLGMAVRLMAADLAGRQGRRWRFLGRFHHKECSKPAK